MSDPIVLLRPAPLRLSRPGPLVIAEPRDGELTECVPLVYNGAPLQYNGHPLYYRRLRGIKSYALVWRRRQS